MIYKPAPGLSYSQIAAWLKCRQKWDWQYRQHLTPRVQKRCMRVGSASHLGFTSIILGQDPEEKIQEALREILMSEDFSVQEIDEQREVADLGLKLARHYIQYIDLDAWETVEYDGKPLVEQRLFAPIDGWEDPAHGSMDWVAREKSSGLVFVWDFKFRNSQLVPEWAEHIDLQLPFYRWILQQNGVKTDAAMKWQAKAQLPKDPKVNKDGSLSRQKIATTWEHYKSCVKKAGLDPADYEDMIPKLEGVETYRATPTYQSLEEVENIIRSVILPAAGEIYMAWQVYPSVSHWNCNSCQYLELCTEMIAGHDLEHIKQLEFKTESEPHTSPEELFVLLD